MSTLVLLYSLKSIYNHNIDSIVVPNLEKQACQSLGKNLTVDLKNLNSDIEVTFYCE
jgi:hypothetical protein